MATYTWYLVGWFIVEYDEEAGEYNSSFVGLVKPHLPGDFFCDFARLEQEQQEVVMTAHKISAAMELVRA